MQPMLRKLKSISSKTRRIWLIKLKLTSRIIDAKVARTETCRAYLFTSKCLLAKDQTGSGQRANKMSKDHNTLFPVREAPFQETHLDRNLSSNLQTIRTPIRETFKFLKTRVALTPLRIQAALRTVTKSAQSTNSLYRETISWLKTLRNQIRKRLHHRVRLELAPVKRQQHQGVVVTPRAMD